MLCMRQFLRSCIDLHRFWVIHATFVICIIRWVFTHSLSKLFVRKRLGRSDLSLLINTTCCLLINSLLKSAGCKGNMSSWSLSTVRSFVRFDHLHQTHCINFLYSFSTVLVISVHMNDFIYYHYISLNSIFYKRWGLVRCQCYFLILSV